MLPTPSTSHVPYTLVYEPAEDSFLLLDTLSSPTSLTFHTSHFPPSSPTPLVLEIGPGSGVVLAFLTAHANHIFSRPDILTLGIDINSFACASTAKTVSLASQDHPTTSGEFLSAVQGDLTSCLRGRQVDVLVFNPPYVPTEDLPALPERLREKKEGKVTFEEESKLLELSYAGGKDGMETTDRVIDSLGDVLSERGVAYLLLCAGNKPEVVKQRIREMDNAGEGRRWKAETVGTSGRQAGWEKLQIVRIWRE
ncbi:S-adenosylmethionine-dependent methyltransferase [Podospora pseudocomata]|uniref:S-adenosylmethionine-dependent methyltransferase n=1 Tax=Podospora pseudocomata TaxID=2093779 RepID=A0ABR0GXG3_9PEZI|nr:S-adenosylmethionine-dependent methyltransferase [Podospora pseudocomata]